MNPQPRFPLKDITNKPSIHSNNHNTRSETTTISILRGPTRNEIGSTCNLSAPINTPRSQTLSSNSSASRQSSSNATPNHTSTPSLELQDAELWWKLHHLNNEMIVMPLGRSLFPLLDFRALYLDPQAEYSVTLTLEMTDSTRHRFSNGRWNPTKPLGHDDTSSSIRPAPGPSGSSSATAVKPIRLRQFYTHPDGFKSGDHWMRHAISFDKIKISNKTVASPSSDTKTASSSKLFSVTTNHKYRPQLHLTQRQQGKDDLLWTFDYLCTEFIAVTHYQNDDVRNLKTLNNPHAAAFKRRIGQLTPPVEIQVRPGEKRQRQHEQQQSQKRQRQQEQEQPQKRLRHQEQQREKERQEHHRLPLYRRSSNEYESPSASSERKFSNPSSNILSTFQCSYPPLDLRYQGTPPATTFYYAGEEVWSEPTPIQYHQQWHEVSQYLHQQDHQLQREQQQEPSYNPLNLLVVAMEILEYQNSQKNKPGQDADAFFRDGVDGFDMFAFQ
ncbi:hypothetical protein BGX30_012032 [Mortierella sp. GBA39]|nr:hypothetical protein BGX30_012032 [Mortierella sp. GBA39]